MTQRFARFTVDTDGSGAGSGPDADNSTSAGLVRFQAAHLDYDDSADSGTIITLSHVYKGASETLATVTGNTARTVSLRFEDGGEVAAIGIIQATVASAGGALTPAVTVEIFAV